MSDSFLNRPLHCIDEQILCFRKPIINISRKIKGVANFAQFLRQSIKMERNTEKIVVSQFLKSFL